ncbi:MAG: glutamine--fructose-6-phosphate aminotransferase [Gemmatimonadetes bacterium 13_1_40CM_70_15]|nr:MAG: glutamine--fructose-6-phosphate aminotransferase [Gemmatimonadetes bacterium 13_1_40CM_70_15]
MCGIVGYVGRREATPILLEGLARLEYRGYDSAGVAVQNGRGIVTRKLAGRIPALAGLVARDPAHGTCGVAHTRWATHGAATERNAHPHADCRGTLALVHNGIIENADALRTRLARAGHEFATETDTETLVHLIEDAAGASLEERVIAVLSQVEGTYGVAVIAAAEPQKIVVARRGSPVLLGIAEGDVAVLTPDGYRVLDRDARPQDRAVDDLDWHQEALALGSYAHFMLKEICEQPETVRNTLRGRLVPADGTARLNGLNLSAGQCARLRRIVIVGCGTSWHAGLVGRYVLEELVGMPVDVEYASEYRYRRQLRVPGTLTVAISQSGETADTLEALRAARAAGSFAVGLVNVVGSTIAREADGGIYLHAGPEVGVASTKTFTSQIVALLLLGLHLGRRRNRLSLDAGRGLVTELARLPELLARTLEFNPSLRELARDLAGARNALYLGRGVNFPVALEGALKLKEISYIHAEGYPAAEMKHGPIALIDEDMPVVFLAPKDHVYTKILSNMQEVKARGGRIIAVTSEGNGELAGLADHVLRVPASAPLVSPVLTVIPLQLLAYHIAVLRGCDVDRPRNLAKSVTVE